MKETYFYSYGGSGLKYITSKTFKNRFDTPFFLEYHKNHNPHLFADKQPQLIGSLKPQDEESKGYQNKVAILIYANPVNAFLSYWRRSADSGTWINNQSNTWINNHFKNMTGNIQPLIKESNIKDWLANNDSFSLLEEWFDSYYDLDSKIDILFVKYESLALSSTQEAINEVTQLDLDFKDLQKRNDSKTILKLSNAEINKLSNILSGLINKQLFLPDTILKTRSI